MACNISNYQFTPVPTQLFLCLDNNCRSVLFTLIQLSTYFESKGGITDGWFFRTNADLEAETGLSKNVLSGALDALYQKKIIGIIPQEKGKGKKQESRKYKVFFDEFLKYEETPIEECYKNPEHRIKTSDYKKGIPTFQQTLIPTSQQTSLPTSQPTFGKSDNNIDNIENIDNTEKLNKENNIILNTNLLNNNILYNKNDFFDSKSISVFKDKFEDEMNESELKSENAEEKEEKTESSIFEFKEKEEKKESARITDNTSFNLKVKDKGCCEARCNDEGQGGVALRFARPFIPTDVEADVVDAMNYADSVKAYFLYGDKFDNFTEQANVLLGEDSRMIFHMLNTIKQDVEWKDAAIEHISEKLKSIQYESEEAYEKTLYDLWSYYFKSKAGVRETERA